jgi:hypothetical protein
VLIFGRSGPRKIEIDWGMRAMRHRFAANGEIDSERGRAALASLAARLMRPLLMEDCKPRFGPAVAAMVPVAQMTVWLPAGIGTPV